MSFSDFSIKIFENDKMMNIFTIKPHYMSKFCVSPNKISPFESTKKEIINKCRYFDISENFVLYYNNCENLEIIEKVREGIPSNSLDMKTHTFSPKDQTYSLGNMTIDAIYGKVSLII